MLWSWWHGDLLCRGTPFPLESYFVYSHWILLSSTQLCTNHRLLMEAALVRMVRRSAEQVSLVECYDENNIKPICSKYLFPNHRASIQLYWFVCYGVLQQHHSRNLLRKQIQCVNQSICVNHTSASTTFHSHKSYWWNNLALICDFEFIDFRRRLPLSNRSDEMWCR